MMDESFPEPYERIPDGDDVGEQPEMSYPPYNMASTDGMASPDFYQDQEFEQGDDALHQALAYDADTIGAMAVAEEFLDTELGMETVSEATKQRLFDVACACAKEGW